jgi:hypothetical protein
MTLSAMSCILADGQTYLKLVVPAGHHAAVRAAVAPRDDKGSMAAAAAAAAAQ